MPKKFRDYLLKMKTSNSRTPQIRLPFNSLLSGCKHPRTPSFALYVDNRNNNNKVSNTHKDDDAATLADIDRFLFENFKSLYLKDTKEEETTIETTKTVLFQEQAPKLGSFLYNDPPMPRHLRESTRFFVKPAFSGSLVEDGSTTSDEVGSVSTINDVSSSNSYNEKESAMEHALPDNSIVLLTQSTSPYEDFKRSMQEMVNNHERVVDWDFMEELLFCYLNVNEKKSHKFILSAFVDLINVMRRNDVSGNTDSPKPPRSVRTVRTGSELRNNLTKNFTLEFGSS